MSDSARRSSCTFLVEAATRHQIWICASVPTRWEDGVAYNTLVLAGPAGELHRYKKIHPFTYSTEPDNYGSGSEFLTVNIDGVRVTFFVCYDLRFADEFWSTAADTDAYVVPANWPERRRVHWRALLHARAIENQAYIIGVNRVGTGDGLPYSGDSMIVDPWGEILVSAAATEALGLTVEELRDEIRGGSNLAEIAGEQGVTVDDLVAANVVITGRGVQPPAINPTAKSASANPMNLGRSSFSSKTMRASITVITGYRLLRTATGASDPRSSA